MRRIGGSGRLGRRRGIEPLAPVGAMVAIAGVVALGEQMRILGVFNDDNKMGRYTRNAPYVNAVFRVQRGASAPADAPVSVFYRGDWYWIAANDLTARRVFALVRDLFDLQVKAGAETQPVLTVPVGR